MHAHDLGRLGVPTGEPMSLALEAAGQLAGAGEDRAAIEALVRAVVAFPKTYLDDARLGPLAAALAARGDELARFDGREAPAPYQQWGEDLEWQSVQQMENACKLPVAVRGALMPDAHLGYGLPIGGVLATRNAVIPYAVGVDIACRMKMTVLDVPADTLDTPAGEERLVRALVRETRFGIGAAFKTRERRQHAVLDEDWAVTEVTASFKDKAWKQLGTSGSGNHFVEFGALTLEQEALGLAPGTYLALLSHSGSRGTGAAVASHFSKRARALHPDLPRELSHLSWLGLDSDDGQAYWAAMELMGRYAAANHDCIHRHVVQALGAEVLLDVENHHNFAWKEVHDGEEVIVHRKGATPAGEGVLGIIPGSMATPAYLVRGRGNEAALQSAAHGAGRRMSRTEAKRRFTWPDVRGLLAERKVRLLSAGLDEVPMAYKDIDEVMAAQDDLVERLASFQPRLVKMAPAGERPED